MQKYAFRLLKCYNAHNSFQIIKPLILPFEYYQIKDIMWHAPERVNDQKLASPAMRTERPPRAGRKTPVTPPCNPGSFL